MHSAIPRSDATQQQTRGRQDCTQLYSEATVSDNRCESHQYNIAHSYTARRRQATTDAKAYNNALSDTAKQRQATTDATPTRLHTANEETASDNRRESHQYNNFSDTAKRRQATTDAKANNDALSDTAKRRQATSDTKANKNELSDTARLR